MQQKSRNKSLDFMLSLILLCLFLSTLNFIDRYYFAAYIAFALFCLSRKGRMYASPFAGACLYVLGFSWVLFSPNALPSVFSILKPFTYVLFYVMGFSLVYREDQEESLNEKLFLLLVCVLAAGAFAHYVLNWITNMGAYRNRDTIDIWTKAALAATGQASFAIMSMGLAVAGLFSKNSIKIKLVCIGVLGVIIAYNLVLSGRTLFLLLIIAMVTAFLHQLVREGKRVRTALTFALIITAICVAYNSDFLGIRTAVMESPFYSRFFGERSMELSEDSRMDRKLKYLVNMLDYPWGGLHMREMAGYAHDIFLDTYDEAGIFALLAMIFFLLQALGNLLRCLANKNLSFGLRQTVLCLYLLVMTEFVIEPILQGMPWMFASLCFIDGALKHLLIREKALRLKPPAQTVG